MGSPRKGVKRTSTWESTILPSRRACASLAALYSPCDGGRRDRKCRPVPRPSTARPKRDHETQQLYSRVGAWVRARREELGFSQGDVIKALGYRNRQSVSNIENGTEGV